MAAIIANRLRCLSYSGAWSLALAANRRICSSSRTAINSCFSDAQAAAILTRLNQAKAEDLAASGVITTSRAIALCRIRDVKGGFDSVADLYGINGVGATVAQALCDYLLHGAASTNRGDAISPATSKNNRNSGDGVEEEDDVEERSRRPASRHTLACSSPRMTVEQAASIQSFAALDIGQNQVTWCAMTRDGLVTDWNRTKFLDTPFARQTHATIHERLAEVTRFLPIVDCYIVELKRARCSSLKFLPLVVNQAVSEAVLLTMLDMETYKSAKRHCVFKLRQSAVSGLFGLNVGSERVSGHRIVESMIENRGGAMDSDPVPSNFVVDLSPIALQRFRQTGDIERESFCNTLLLAFAFSELVLKPVETSAALCSVDNQQQEGSGAS